MLSVVLVIVLDEAEVDQDSTHVLPVPPVSGALDVSTNRRNQPHDLPHHRNEGDGLDNGEKEGPGEIRHSNTLGTSTPAKSRVARAQGARLNCREAVNTGGLVSDHVDSMPGASENAVNPVSGQPQTRRERRLLEEAARATAQSTLEPPAPVSTAATTTGPIPSVEPHKSESTGPIPFVEKVPSGSIPAITAPDVATLTPLEPATRTKRSDRREGRPAVVRKVRLRPESAKRKSRAGFVPRAGQALRRAAKQTWSTTIRGFVVLVIGAFLVTLTLPSTGFNLALPGYAATETGDHQEVTTKANTEVATSISLGEYGVNNYGATRFGSGNWSYSVSTTGAIRWPFPYAAPISSGFGSRVAPCAACSTYHKGLDFDPQEGSPIYAVADGVVSEVHNDQWGFGRWVVIHHEVKGLVFDSVYAHMERDSVDLKVGDVVKVADYVGRVGNTGTSTGAHLHLEIHENGIQVDPYEWLKKHTKK